MAIVAYDYELFLNQIGFDHISKLAHKVETSKHLSLEMSSS